MGFFIAMSVPLMRTVLATQARFLKLILAQWQSAAKAQKAQSLPFVAAQERPSVFGEGGRPRGSSVVQGPQGTACLFQGYRFSFANLRGSRSGLCQTTSAMPRCAALAPVSS